LEKVFPLMKIRFSAYARRAAFTLVELLVVMAIIAILIALLFPAINTARLGAQKSATRTEMSHIVAAVKHFYADYSSYPLPTTQMQDGLSGKDVAFGTPSNNNCDLFDILRSLPGHNTNGLPSPNTGNKFNPKLIVYYEASNVKDANNPRGGFATQPVNNIAIGDLIDPWGTPYMVFIDANYDGKMSFGPLHVWSDMLDTQLDVGVASCGKDQTIGTKGNNLYQNSDDLVSWK
jgi:prepilin-type N-terminal cleavage/methylation domain-containing protein